MMKIIVNRKYFIFLVFIFSGFSYSEAIFPIAAAGLSAVTLALELGNKSQAFSEKVVKTKDSMYEKYLRPLILTVSVVAFGGLAMAWAHDRAQTKKERGSGDKDMSRPVYVIVAKEGEQVESALNAVVARSSG